MKRLISGGIKDATIQGNIVEIKRNHNNKLLFRIEMCNTLSVEVDEVKSQVSPTNWIAGGHVADVIEANFKNGDLVTAKGFVSVSDENKTVKFIAQKITLFYPLVKEAE